MDLRQRDTASEYRLIGFHALKSAVNGNVVVFKKPKVNNGLCVDSIDNIVIIALCGHSDGVNRNAFNHLKDIPTELDFLSDVLIGIS